MTANITLSVLLLVIFALPAIHGGGGKTQQGSDSPKSDVGQESPKKEKPVGRHTSLWQPIRRGVQNLLIKRKGRRSKGQAAAESSSVYDDHSPALSSPSGGIALQRSWSLNSLVHLVDDEKEMPKLSDTPPRLSRNNFRRENDQVIRLPARELRFHLSGKYDEEEREQRLAPAAELLHHEAVVEATQANHQQQQERANVEVNNHGKNSKQSEEKANNKVVAKGQASQIEMAVKGLNLEKKYAEKPPPPSPTGETSDLQQKSSPKNEHRGNFDPSSGKEDHRSHPPNVQSSAKVALVAESADEVTADEHLEKKRNKSEHSMLDEAGQQSPTTAENMPNDRQQGKTMIEVVKRRQDEEKESSSNKIVAQTNQNEMPVKCVKLAEKCVEMSPPQIEGTSERNTPLKEHQQENDRVSHIIGSREEHRSDHPPIVQSVVEVPLAAESAGEIIACEKKPHGSEHLLEEAGQQSPKSADNLPDYQQQEKANAKVVKSCQDEENSNNKVMGDIEQTSQGLNLADNHVEGPPPPPSGKTSEGGASQISSPKPQNEQREKEHRSHHPHGSAQMESSAKDNLAELLVAKDHLVKRPHGESEHLKEAGHQKAESAIEASSKVNRGGQLYSPRHHYPELRGSTQMSGLPDIIS